MAKCSPNVSANSAPYPTTSRLQDVRRNLGEREIVAFLPRSIIHPYSILAHKAGLPAY